MSRQQLNHKGNLCTICGKSSILLPEDQSALENLRSYAIPLRISPTPVVGAPEVEVEEREGEGRQQQHLAKAEKMKHFLLHRSEVETYL